MDEGFRQNLFNISEGLGSEDLRNLISLCSERGVLTTNDAETIQTGCDLFDKLIERDKLSENYVWYLADLLLAIGHNSLLDCIGLGELTEEQHKKRRCQLNPYRLLLTQIATELSKQDLAELKKQFKWHNRGNDKVEDFYDLVRYLEKQRQIGPKSGIKLLVDGLREAELLDEKIKRSVNQYEMEMGNDQDKRGRYRMSSSPKGLCIIINNVEFAKQEENSLRRGSDVDAGRLHRLFESIGFEVEKKRNLRSTELTEFLTEVSRRDHWCYDAFVCCVLSHGSLGHVFGVDNIAVEIQSLLDLFSGTNCRGLDDKPKVFFLQACQGEGVQRGSASVRAGEKHSAKKHGGVSSDTNQVSSDTFIDDVALTTAQLGPDLLLGYATTPGNKAFRSYKDGSWYIEELVNCLKKHATEYDLLTILTMVNDKVSKKDGVEDGCSVKQIPSPVFTLKKQLYLK